MTDQIITGGDQPAETIENAFSLSPCGGFALMSLPHSQRRALIDAADLERVQMHLWMLCWNEDRPYVRATVWSRGAWVPVSLGNFIAKPGIGQTARHANGSTLDARRGNLTMRKRRRPRGVEDRHAARVQRQAEFEAISAEAMRRAAEMAPSRR